MITNLSDYLNYFCASSPWAAGRRLYKDTACGPWTIFLYYLTPVFTRNVTLAVGRSTSGKLRVVYREEGMGYRDTVEMGDLSLLGFDARGFARRGWYSLTKFRKAATDFATRQKNKDVRIMVHPGHPHSGEFDRRRVWITLEQDIPEVMGEVYYEDKAATSDIPDCVGVKIGTIVEGSDACPDSVTLLFPFTKEDLDKTVQELNAEASAMWEEANSETEEEDGE